MQQSTTQIRPQIDPRCHVVNHDEAWPHVLPGLQALHAMYDDQDWSVEGVKELLDDGDAVLLVDDEDQTGFAVVYVQNSIYHPGELELFIYLMWHQGGNAIGRFCRRFDEMARAAEARHIRFYSRRRGMGRLMARQGFSTRDVEYVKEV